MEQGAFRKFAKSIPYARKIYQYIYPPKRDILTGVSDIEYICSKSGLSLIRNKHHDMAVFFPYPSRELFNITQLRILRRGFDVVYEQKYSEGLFRVRPGDDVIDCGGFVGGFSLAAIRMGAERVIHVEPTPATRRCAALNFLLYGVEDRIIQFSGGLSDSDGKGLLNLSASYADNSFLEPDAGATGQSIEVTLTTLEALAGAHGITPEKCFLKVEAEGYEVEVIKGMGAFRPRTVAVDVTPERGGESPRDEIRALLEAFGYKNFANTKRCLFASH